MSFKLPTYTLSPSGCEKSLKLTLFNSEVDGVPKTNPMQLPGLIRLKEDTQEIVIFGLNQEEGNKYYTFYVTALEPLSAVGDKNPFTFNLLVRSTNEAPMFIPEV